MRSKSVLIVMVAIVSFGLGWYGHQAYNFRNGSDYTRLTKLVRENSTQYTFVNPLLFIDNARIIFPELDPLKDKIQEYIAKAISEKDVREVSIYFRDLNTTRWTGIDEDKLYDPASMQKVVLLIAYLKGAENNPSSLNKKLYYTGNTDRDSFYQVEHVLHKGNYYSIQDLLADMIVKSGNDSTKALFDNIDKHELEKVYGDLSFSLPIENQPELISAKIYSRLFRVLYSATYLPSTLSDEALSLMSQSEFDKGLKSNLPTDVLIAHKFGERTITVAGQLEERQLHDCGIIYYPDHPYFLCVMTKGQDFYKLQKVIAEISDITYQYWDKFSS